MRIAVTGSIAVDHLMSFPGRFTEQLVASHLDRLSLSFLVDRLDLHFGGVAVNIAVGLGRLGSRPILVGAVGRDFEEYRPWLSQQGVDTESVLVVPDRHTARFLCTTDLDQNQIASFYSGAMTEARRIRLTDLVARVGDVDLVVVGANDPDAMLRHTAECRDRGYRFAADPSQQLALMDGASIRALVEGATYLFTNEYEHALLVQKTGWGEPEVLARVGCWITTLGAAGARIESSGHPPIEVTAVGAEREADPTGSGDAFRAGFLAGASWGLGPAGQARLGCAIATLVLETNGTTGYDLDTARLVARITAAYGADAAAEIAPALLAGLAPTRAPAELVAEP